MSVDVSPDGQSVVFDLLGDLYTAPITGGAARHITSGMAFDAQPRYSPDGRRLVFTSDRDGWVNVWVSASDGSQPRQMTRYRWSEGATVESPEWTPDGESIVYTERLISPQNGQRLAEIPTDGGAPKSITHGISRSAESPDADITPEDAHHDVAYRGPSFGPDSTFVYAAAKPYDDWSKEFWQIIRIDRRTRKTAFVTTALSGMSAMRPVLSPNGRYMVFSAPTGAGTGLRIRDLRTAEEKWLTRSSQRTTADVPAMSYDSRDLVPGSSFTPDSRSVVTSIDGKIWRIDVETGRSAEIAFTATVNQAVGPLVRSEYAISDAPFTVRAIQHLQLSPDGSRCVFTALDRVWIATLPRVGRQSSAASIQTSEQTSTVVPTRLTDRSAGEFFPAWSPDGRYIVFASWSDQQHGALYRVRSDGRGAPELLTRDSGFYSMPVYTRDGAEILAVRGPAEAFRASAERSTWLDDLNPRLELVRLPARGGAVQRLSEYRVPSSAPWKPVLFRHKRPQSIELDRVYVYDPDAGVLSIHLDGADQRPLLTSVIEGTFKAWEVLVSPSGQYGLALMSGSERPYLFTIPDASPRPLTISLSDERANPRGVRVWQLSRTGASNLGWTADNRPYFSAGGALFVGDTPLGSDDAVATPTFKRTNIDLKVPRDRAIGSLVLKNARLLTMRGREVIERGDLLVRDGRIAGVARAGGLATPADAEVLDVRGATILPGYVDVHDHVGFAVSFGVHTSEAPRLLVELAYGVTTLRDPFGRGVDLMAYGERAAAGDLVAPRIYAVNANVTSASFGDGARQDLEETREVLRYWSDYYHSETIKQYLAGGRRTRQLVAMAAFEQGLTPTNEGGDTSMQLTMALDGYAGVEHTFLAKPVFRDVTQLFALTGTVLTPTLGVHLGWQSFLAHEELAAEPKFQRFYPEESIKYAVSRLANRESMWVDAATVRAYAAAAARIVEAGGCVAMGSHGNIPGLGAHYELWYLAEGGMSNYDVLRAATICGALSIGHEKDLGSIEPGKLADLQILDRNPLDDINNTRSIRYVMKGGRLYDANTLDELWPRQRSLQRPR